MMLAGNGDVWIEEPREVDAVSLGYQAQKVAAAIEGPWSAHLHEFEGRLDVAVDEALAEPAVCVAVDDLEALLADPPRGLDSGGAGGGEAGDTGAGGQVFKAGHQEPLFWARGVLRALKGSF